MAAAGEMGLEATELRLGLPGGGGEGEAAVAKNSGKRGFSETIDLKLKLETVDSKAASAGAGEGMRRSPSQKSVLPPAPAAAANDPAKPPAPK